MGNDPKVSAKSANWKKASWEIKITAHVKPRSKRHASQEKISTCITVNKGKCKQSSIQMRYRNYTLSDARESWWLNIPLSNFDRIVLISSLSQTFPLDIPYSGMRVILTVALQAENRDPNLVATNNRTVNGCGKPFI